MSPPQPHSPALRIGVTAAALALVLAGTAWFVRADYRYVRIRNSLLFELGRLDDVSWPGDAPPADFRVERDVPDDFRRLVRDAVGWHSSTDALADAKRIGSHLAEVARPGRRSLQASTVDAYHGIRAGRGNCSDFSQVVNGMAAALELPVREWGMFFDDFGGSGHAFNEIWDARRGKWLLIDTYNSFYPTERSTGEPLSVLEFRERLLAGQGLAELQPVALDLGRFERVVRREEALLEYYRAGLVQLGLWYANDVFTYDGHPLVRAFRPFPAALTQAVAILGGVHPRLRILVTADNRAAIDAMVGARNVFFACVAVAGLLAVALAAQVWAALRSARARRAPGPQPLAGRLAPGPKC